MIDSPPTPARKTEVRFGQRLSRGGHWRRSVLCSGPAVIWLGLLLVVPLLIVIGISFLTRGEYGGVELPLTVESYKRLAGFGELGFDPLYPVILLRSLVLGGATAALCLVMALPLAFFTSESAGSAAFGTGVDIELQRPERWRVAGRAPFGADRLVEGAVLAGDALD